MAEQQPDGTNHIGWDLWQANRAWRRRFVDMVAACGYPWFGEARAKLLPHIGRHGLSQNEIALRMRISKQAVQQLLDELERDGVIERAADPGDARRKLARLTPAGMDVLDKANDITRMIEADYAALLGEAGFSALKDALAAIRTFEAARR